MTIGEKIRVRRNQLNMTMEDLGKAIGVQRSAINKYEKDLIDFKTSTILALSKALNVSVFYLLDEDPHEELSSDDKALLDAYHEADSITQSNIRKILGLPEKDIAQSAI